MLGETGYNLVENAFFVYSTVGRVKVVKAAKRFKQIYIHFTQ